jgi:hypothetical protein
MPGRGTIASYIFTDIKNKARMSGAPRPLANRTAHSIVQANPPTETHTVRVCWARAAKCKNQVRGKHVEAFPHSQIPEWSKVCNLDVTWSTGSLAMQASVNVTSASMDPRNF